MSLTGQQTIDYPSWAQRANARWLVHGGLGTCAAAFMARMELQDRNRLIHACRNAYLMVWQRDCREDPKLYFYGGLFSLATREEIEEFLSGESLGQLMLELRSGRKSPAKALPADIAPHQIQPFGEALAKLPEYP